MAKEELFRPALKGYFIKRFGAFMVRRQQIDRNAIRQAEKTLADGNGLCMFPEGHRSCDSKLQTALPGSGFIAARAGAPIVPAAVTGTTQIKGYFWFVRRPHLTVTFGKTFRLPPTDSASAKEQLNHNTEKIMEHIAALLPPEMRGVYAETVKVGR